MGHCPLCPNKHACLPPDGPTSSPNLFIGEAPGPDEDRKKRIFVGKTGQELNRGYMPAGGCRRESSRLINAISCFPDTPKGKLDPKKQSHLDLLASCSNTFLIPEILCNSYRLLVPMGVFACKALDENIDLEIHHGIPIETPWGMTFPMYHPAGGIHEPKKMLQIRNDWIRLRKYQYGQLRLPADDFAGIEDYRIIRSGTELHELLRDTHDLPLACDTEITGKYKPFCLSFSICPGTGYMIMAEDRTLLDIFQMHLNMWQAPILFHNWLFDESVVKRMGLRFPDHLIVDTMVEAFHLGNLPQGLKALSYRELGMLMQDFYDLVSPYSKTKCIDYLMEAKMVDWPKPEVQMVRQDDGTLKKYQPQSMKTKLKRFFTDYRKQPDKDIFKSWKNWEQHHDLIENEVGEWPGICITHAPIEKVIFYACRDADALLRLWPRLKGMIKKVRKTTQENWGDN